MRLGLTLRKHQTRIFGLGVKDELYHQGTTDFLLTPKTETAISARAFVMSKLTNVLPSTKVSGTSWKHLPNFILVEPTCNTPSGIDLIIRAELYETIMLEARMKKNNNITNRNSLFSWIVIGGSSSLPIQSLTTWFSSMKLIPEDTLKKFWR